MRTRWDEIAEPFERLAQVLGVGDREHLRAIVARTGWGARTLSQPLLPSGVRHGAPWGLSISMTPHSTELRVFLEAQADPPSRERYLAAADALLEGIADASANRAWGRPERLWHAVSYGRGRAPLYQAYACVPAMPDFAWRALAERGHGARLRDALPPRARVTMIAADLHAASRLKLYVLVPDAAVDELPLVDAETTRFARLLLGDDRRIGWLVCYGFLPGHAEPASVALHFGAAVHADAGFADRLAIELETRGLHDYARACAALGSVKHHFVAYTQGEVPRINVYFLPEVAR